MGFVLAVVGLQIVFGPSDRGVAPWGRCAREASRDSAGLRSTLTAMYVHIFKSRSSVDDSL
jgi:hypothetical protein